ncbi:SPT3 Dosage dependent suppressor of Ty-induced promoter mutations-like protein [Elasticomyces elasticus]|nr:SPT3 Dosage dependent suppressor of Ty-induced promoter mutations-like protein [Elasticomyces elasticus]
MDNRNTLEEPFWDDPVFTATSTFDQSMEDSSPYGGFADFTNSEFYTEDANTVRAPSVKPTPTTAGAQQQQHVLGATAESSSQDSASDTSSRRKRKVSESPESTASQDMVMKKEDSMEVAQGMKMQQMEYMPVRPMHELSLQHDGNMNVPYDFGSNASSPAQTRDFHIAMPTNTRAYMPTTMAQFHQSPVQTINPGMFQIGRDESPAHIAGSGMFNNPSPGAMFSTPSSDSNDIVNGNPVWPNGLSANPAWPNPMEYNNHYTPPAVLGFSTPSPRPNGAASAGPSRGSVGPLGRTPLRVAPITSKSRVETQINIFMTLEQPPIGIDNVHLPLHTIAKSKLLAKDDYDVNKTLEVQTMLVCTSAMRNPQLRDKAMQRAATQTFDDIERRADLYRRNKEKAEREGKGEDKNVELNVDEADKPANGGEVRICNNCIKREQKRAGRKKVKKEEEQKHWENYESERVVVFNSSEYLELKPPDQATKDADPTYVPPDGALVARAAMRIACYCRHQQEKEGFQVIFTLKDQVGNVVAQQISDSIHITDDHKTHPHGFSAALPGDNYGVAFGGNGSLSTSHSMVGIDMHSVTPFASSRSTGDLQGMYPSSHVHQMSNSAYGSQATSATMTPMNLSRPGSPTNAGNTGPNKKRKSSNFGHGRMPSGLTMTPRVDTSQPPSSGMPSAMSATSPFSPTGEGFTQQPYIAMPTHNGGPQQFFGSGPPTPSEHQHGHFTPANLAHLDQAIARNQQQAYFSHPSSAVPSRSSSPVMSSRPNMAAYARHPIQTSTNNTMQARQAPYQQQQQQQHVQHHPQHQQQHPQAQSQQQYAQRPALSNPGSTISDSEQGPVSISTITKMTPTEGPIGGGTEVAMFGYNFMNGMTVMFGDQVAAATYYGPQALLAVSPPSRPGGVNVSLVPPQGQQMSNQYQQPSVRRQIFTYTERDPRLEMEVRMYLQQQQQMQQQQQQQHGNQAGRMPMSSQMPGQYPQSNIGQGGQRDQGY